MTTPDEDTLRSAPPACLSGVDVCRAISTHPELRVSDSEEEGEGIGVMHGHFSRFNEWYEINSWFEGHFIERIAPGAFKRTFKNRSGQSPVRVLLEHGFDPTVGDKPLGRHLALEEDDRGAYAEVDLFDTSYNRDLLPALRGGAYGQSFRFQVVRDDFVEPGEDGFDDSVPKKWRDLPQRTIGEVRISEHGPTVFPASPTTTAEVRSTSDDFYERLRRRDPEAFDNAVARSQTLRTPQTPAATRAAGQPEDPQAQHSEDPPANEARHSEDPQGEHSEVATHATNPLDSERSSAMEPNPMTIEERTARQSEIRARLSEIDQEFAGSEFSEEARAEFDALTEEFDRNVAALEDIRRRQEAIAARAEDTSSTERVRTTQVAPTTGRRGGSTNADIFDLGAIRQQARSVDDLPRLYRDNAMRAVEVARFPGVQDRARAQAQVEHLLDSVDDESGSLARRLLTTGSPVYERAFGKVLAKGGGGLTAEEQRALSLGADAEGGYAVPFQLDPSIILTSDGVADPLRQISRVVQITGKEWQGVTSAGVVATRTAEAGASTDDSPSLDQPTVRTTQVRTTIPYSIEIEQDWAAMRSEITTLLADAKITEEADSFINGNGVGVNPQGLLTGTTAAQNVQPATAATFSDDDLYNLEEALPERWLANATFLAHRSFYNAVRQLGADGDGGNLWVRLGDGLPPELIGYPARRQSEMPVFNTAAADGTVQAVLGDFRQFLIVDRVGMNVELVQHLPDPATGLPTGKRAILALWRNSCKVLVPGAFRRLVTFDGVA